MEEAVEPGEAASEHGAWEGGSVRQVADERRVRRCVLLVPATQRVDGAANRIPDRSSGQHRDGRGRAQQGRDRPTREAGPDRAREIESHRTQRHRARHVGTTHEVVDARLLCRVRAGHVITFGHLDREAQDASVKLSFKPDWLMFNTDASFLGAANAAGSVAVVAIPSGEIVADQHFPEGIVSVGAVAAFAVAYHTHNPGLGILAGMAAGIAATSMTACACAWSATSP